LQEADYQLLEVRYSCPLQAGRDPSLGKVPTTVTSAATIAALQTQETIKLLHDRSVKPGVGYFFSGESNRITELEYPWREDCFSHDSLEGPIHDGKGLSAQMTLGDLIERMQGVLGCEVRLELDWDVVRRVECLHCRTSEPIGEPFVGPVPGAWPCPTCGAPRAPEISHTLDSTMELNDRTLAELGVPLGDILTLRYAQGYYLVELTEDIGAFEAFAWSPTQ
jgi:adenylyltransferase/sulfurtransferase